MESVDSFKSAIIFFLDRGSCFNTVVNISCIGMVVRLALKRAVPSAIIIIIIQAKTFIIRVEKINAHISLYGVTLKYV